MGYFPGMVIQIARWGFAVVLFGGVAYLLVSSFVGPPSEPHAQAGLGMASWLILAAAAGFYRWVIRKRFQLKRWVHEKTRDF